MVFKRISIFRILLRSALVNRIVLNLQLFINTINKENSTKYLNPHHHKEKWLTRKILCTVKIWSGRRDLNSRPTGPKPVALPNCATPRTWSWQRDSNPHMTLYKSVPLTIGHASVNILITTNNCKNT